MTFRETLEASYKENFKKWKKQMAGGNITPEMAEDIVQLACEKALMGQDSYDKERDFDKWLSGIMYNARCEIVNQERSGGMSGRSL
jgi:DNA-directed RNA polymerase specialized sigma24 family protein